MSLCFVDPPRIHKQEIIPEPAYTVPVLNDITEPPRKLRGQSLQAGKGDNVTATTDKIDSEEIDGPTTSSIGREDTDGRVVTELFTELEHMTTSSKSTSILPSYVTIAWIISIQHNQ